MNALNIKEYEKYKPQKLNNDLVLVVRCKDCKNIQNDGWCKYYRHNEREDWFCADGKLKDRSSDNGKVY